MDGASNEAWHSGQRVRQAVSDRAVPYGTPGIIHQVFHDSGLLAVAFDGDPALRVIGNDEVELERAVGE